jgi:2-keto-4-pentenoate hydratase/2-oxohepta-3-ene-1,7-dioic acid hydratase in catechol pathway
MTEKADWEVELAVVMGRPARNIGKSEVLDHVAGYCIANDLSARDLLVRDEFGPAQDWLAAKCAPQFMPMGPYLVPTEFVADPNDLSLVLKHNGIVRQSECSSDMIHDVQTIISYASRLVQLMPGDVISTGSPSGNGMEFGIFLQDGDVVEASIEGLGMQRNVFRRETA